MKIQKNLAYRKSHFSWFLATNTSKFSCHYKTHFCFPFFPRIALWLCKIFSQNLKWNVSKTFTFTVSSKKNTFWIHPHLFSCVFHLLYREQIDAQPSLSNIGTQGNRWTSCMYNLMGTGHHFDCKTMESWSMGTGKLLLLDIRCCHHNLWKFFTIMFHWIISVSL